MTHWRDLADQLPRDHRIKAHLAFELACDRADGEPIDVATATLRAVAQAEGLDTGGAWLAAAARAISQGRADRSPRSHDDALEGTR